MIKHDDFMEVQTTYHDTVTRWIVECWIWAGGDIPGTPNRHLIWIVTEQLKWHACIFSNAARQLSS